MAVMQQTPAFLERLAPGLVLLFLMAIACGVYWPGLAGGFLFDDTPNLAPLAQYGGVHDWPTLTNFVLNGFSGPTGRPVALLSFLLDDNTWPSQALLFKHTNLLIHLLVGLLLCWSTLLLMRLWGQSERRCIWVALLNMGIWLLHPYMVSTTLYVVQRMAQLAALFMLVGLAGYLHGRLLLALRPRAAYLWMSASLVLGTLLATLSKENGALLPLLVLVIEFCLPLASRTRAPLPDWRWRAAFLWLPSLAVVGYLLHRVDFNPALWPSRPFNQIERLMSEGRIVWEYLYHLWVPRIEGRGLFQDGYDISRGWLSPPSTLIAAMALAALLCAALLLRRRWPLLSLAVLFFLGAHLIESSVVGLELYFEHRNYAAALFLFLPLAMGLCLLAERVRWPVAAGLCSIVLAMLAWQTWQRATLWGDTERLKNYWAIITPESARAQSHLAIMLFEQGRVAEGMAFLQEAGERLPQSSLLTMQTLLQKVRYGVAVPQDFQLAADQLVQQRFDAQTSAGLRILVGRLLDPGVQAQYREQMLALLARLDQVPAYQSSSVYRRFSPYFQGLLLLSERDIAMAMSKLTEAMGRQVEVEVALSIVGHVGSAGYPQQGLELLEQLRELYPRRFAGRVKGLDAQLRAELDRLEQVLKDDLANVPGAVR